MNTNIFEVKKLNDLKSIMQTCVTVIVGFTLPETPRETKIMIRKFLKNKAKIFKLITFIYMEVTDEDRNTLSILKGDKSEFPKIFHIRDGNKIFVSVNSADQESIYQSFSEVENYYLEEMNNLDKKNVELEEKKKLEKLVLLNQKCDTMKVDLIKEVVKRKKEEESSNGK